jgi:hypothetical protein
MEFGANALMALFAIRRSTRGLTVMLAIAAAVLVIDLTLTQSLTPFVDNASIVKVGYHWGDVHLGVVRTIFSFLTGMVLSRHLEGRLPRVSRWSLAVLALGAVPLFLPLSGWSRFALDLGFILLLSPALVLAGPRWRCLPRSRSGGAFGRDLLPALCRAFLLDLCCHHHRLSPWLAAVADDRDLPHLRAGLRELLREMGR